MKEGEEERREGGRGGREGGREEGEGMEGGWEWEGGREGGREGGEGREGREGREGGRQGGRKGGEGWEGGDQGGRGREVGGGEGGREGRGRVTVIHTLIFTNGTTVFKYQSRHVLRNNVSRCLPMAPQCLKNNHVTYYVITQVGVYAAQQWYVLRPT